MKLLILSVFLAYASAQFLPYSQWSPHNSQFANDLYSKSVDLNKDGQPDVPVYTADSPLLHSYYPYAHLASRTAFPYAYGAPFTYPFYQPNAAPAAPVATKNSRAKRQIAVLPHNPAEFLNDLKYSSVDSNQDGYPDKTVYAAPVMPYTGARFAYPSYPGYYPHVYPFQNGFLA